MREMQLREQQVELPDHLLRSPVLVTHAAEERVVQALSTAVGRAMLALAQLTNGWAPLSPELEEEPPLP
jgi:hypothetical protein